LFDEPFKRKVFRGSVMSMTSIYFSTNSNLPLPFLLMGASIMSSFSTPSFLDDDLVKVLLDLVSTTLVGEGKSNLLPLVPLALADGSSANFGASWGETSHYGE
jgi:hypothetical protein